MKKGILTCYWNICLLRESPENTPFSYFRMIFSAFFFILLMIFEWLAANLNYSNDVIKAVALVFSYAIYTYAILFLKGLVFRWVQTITSLYFINIIIHLLAAPLLYIFSYILQSDLAPSGLIFLGIIYLIISLGLTVWQFVITAHIYKHALNVTVVEAVVAAFGLIATNILTVSLLQ